MKKRTEIDSRISEIEGERNMARRKDEMDVGMGLIESGKREMGCINIGRRSCK